MTAVNEQIRQGNVLHQPGCCVQRADLEHRIDVSFHANELLRRNTRWLRNWLIFSIIVNYFAVIVIAAKW